MLDTTTSTCFVVPSLNVILEIRPFCFSTDMTSVFVFTVMSNSFMSFCNPMDA